VILEDLKSFEKSRVAGLGHAVRVDIEGAHNAMKGCPDGICDPFVPDSPDRKYEWAKKLWPSENHYHFLNMLSCCESFLNYGVDLEFCLGDEDADYTIENDDYFNPGEINYENLQSCFANLNHTNETPSFTVATYQLKYMVSKAVGKALAAVAYCRNCEDREVNTETGDGKGGGESTRSESTERERQGTYYRSSVGGITGVPLVPHYCPQPMPAECQAPPRGERGGEKEGEQYLYVEVDFAEFNGMEANGYQVHLYDLATDTTTGGFKTTWTGTDQGPFKLVTPTLEIKVVGGDERDYVIVVEER